jgi:hypothetical protein
MGQGAVIPVERPKEPRRSNVSSRPAPMRSKHYTETAADHCFIPITEQAVQ